LKHIEIINVKRVIMEEEKNAQQNQEDVNPTSQFDKLVKEQAEEALPDTTGTGSNREVFNGSSLIIKKDEESADQE